eukprot:1152155-Pelagomonas_calceolata.AAC.5
MARSGYRHLFASVSCPRRQIIIYDIGTFFCFSQAALQDKSYAVYEHQTEEQMPGLAMFEHLTHAPVECEVPHQETSWCGALDKISHPQVLSKKACAGHAMAIHAGPLLLHQLPQVQGLVAASGGNDRLAWMEGTVVNAACMARQLVLQSPWPRGHLQRATARGSQGITRRLSLKASMHNCAGETGSACSHNPVQEVNWLVLPLPG